jgi:drug/metabolite transporter (DMT)-like permease
MSWYYLAIASTFFYGIQNFIFKVAAEKKLNSGRVMFSFSATVAFLSVAAFFLSDQTEKNYIALVIIALVNAIIFFISTISKAEALKRIDSSVYFPLDRLNIAIVVVLSFIIFNERFTIFQSVGIFFAVSAFLLLGRDLKSDKHKKKDVSTGLLLTIVSLIAGALSILGIKIASMELNKFAFMAVAYFFNAILSLSFINKLQGKHSKANQTGAAGIGMLIGAFNFVGFYVLLKAYSAGPMSIVAVIQSTSFVLSLVLSVIIYKEKITITRFAAIALSIAAIILLRL